MPAEHQWIHAFLYFAIQAGTKGGDVESSSKIRRHHLVHGKSIRRIAKERKMPRNAVRKKQPMPKLESHCGRRLRRPC